MALYQDLLGGFKMPSVGLGTWNAKDDAELETALDAALQAGYRHIDTAYLYQNEEIIGRVLQKWFSSGKLKRNEIFITTKLPGEAIHPDRVEKFMKISLKALQLDYVDLYLIHTPIFRDMIDGKPVPMPTDHLAVWKKMEEQVDAGRTKAIGLSNFNIRQIERVWQNARIKPSCLQVELSPYLQQTALVQYCHDKGIVVVGYSTLGSAGFMKALNANYQGVLENDTIKQLAVKYNKGPAQIVMRYFLQKNVVMIPKSVTPSRIKQNIDLFNFSLDIEDVQAMEKLEKGEEARLLNPGKHDPASYNHPEYPFK